MRKKRICCKVNLIFLLAILIFGFLDLTSRDLVAQNPKAAQWTSVGGKKLLSGNQKFSKTWTFDSNHRENGFWQGSFYDPVEKRKYASDNTVKNSVSPLVGQIVVQGPGNIGLLERTKGASIVMTQGKENVLFGPWTNSQWWQNNKWEGRQVEEFSPKSKSEGAIPAGKVVTINVEAHMSSYDNMMNTGEFAYRAPQEVAYEVWFFPGDGGKVIKITHLTGHVDKPKPGILYYTEKECH